MAATLREIGKQDNYGNLETPTKADEIMLLPLAHKMGKSVGCCASKQVRAELVEGLGNTYVFLMARKESMGGWLTRVLYYMLFYDKPFQKQR